MGISETPDSHRSQAAGSHLAAPASSEHVELPSRVPPAAGEFTRESSLAWASAGVAAVAILGGAFFGRWMGRQDTGVPQTSIATASLDISPVAPDPAPSRGALENATAQKPQGVTPALTPGWRWSVPPTSIGGTGDLSVSIGDLTFIRLSFTGEPGATPTWSTSENEVVVKIAPEPGVSYQLVGATKSGTRVELNPRTRDGNSRGFILPKEVEFATIGFQSADTGALSAASTKALEEAHRLGVPVLSPPKVGQLYEFSLPTAQGEQLSHETYKGKVVVVFEWATWCGACHLMMKDIFKIAEAHKDTVQLVAISHDASSTLAKARQEMADFPSNTTNVELASFELPEGTDFKGLNQLWALARKGVNGYGIPTVIVLGADGKTLLDSGSPRQTPLGETIIRAVEDAKALTR